MSYEIRVASRWFRWHLSMFILFVCLISKRISCLEVTQIAGKSFPRVDPLAAAFIIGCHGKYYYCMALYYCLPTCMHMLEE